MVNAALAQAFELMADLLEIQGENRFRINAYRRTARTLRDLGEDITDVIAEDRLEELPGVGKGSAEKIHQFLEVGQIEDLESLKSRVPAGLPELLKIPGLGPKKVAAMWSKLQVTSLHDLKSAIESGQLAELEGFGEQSVRKIADGIRFLESSSARPSYGEVLPVAMALADGVRRLPGVGAVEVAGSLRRARDTIGDIDLLCAAQDGLAVIRAFTSLPQVGRVLAAGDTKGSVTVPLAGNSSVQVDLRVVPAESFGAALQYFTGSKEHNVRLRELAIRQGFKLNEWGLFKDGQQVAGRTEGDLYAALGLPHIPPELREDRGELTCDSALFDALVALDRIRGDLHVHTTASDGRSTLEEMARAARDLGYAYLNITDHSRSSVIAGGLSVERLMEHIEEVRAFNKDFQGLEVMVGCECDILTDGRLDYPDEILAACDIVVASVHAAQGQDRQTITQRVIRAIENPHVDILGHPTGRLINRRAPADLDIGEVIKAAVASGTALEVNASWKRLDLKDVHVRQAVEAGAWIAINTDAHHTEQLRQMPLGVATARRGWVTADRVINCMSLASLKTWLAAPSR